MPTVTDEPEPARPAQTTDSETTPGAASTPVSPKTAQRLAIEYQDKAKAEEKEEIKTLDLGEGTVIKLDKLGPMIINSDGVSLNEVN
jgi:hypothetical protein